MPGNALEEQLREERRRRYQLPLLGLLIIGVYAGSRFEPTREVGGYALALGLPAVAAVSSVLPVRHSTGALRVVAVAVALLLVVATEARIAPALWSAIRGGLLASPAWLLALVGTGAVAVDLLAARTGARTYSAAWSGMAIVLAVYLPGHLQTGHVFDFVFAGALFALFVGGGTGVVVSALGRRLTLGRPRAP